LNYTRKLTLRVVLESHNEPFSSFFLVLLYHFGTQCHFRISSASVA